MSRSGRILGHIQIVNDTIRVAEAKLPDEIIQDYFKTLDHAGRRCERPIQATDITWFAYAPDPEDSGKLEKMIGYGVLTRIAPEEVALRWVISPEYRGLGLGKLMARFGTDQAIRYRQRTITAAIDHKNEIALGILDQEDFESSSQPGQEIVRLKKELKWQ